VRGERCRNGPEGVAGGKKGAVWHSRMTRPIRRKKGGVNQRKKNDSERKLENSQGLLARSRGPLAFSWEEEENDAATVETGWSFSRRGHFAEKKKKPVPMCS